ncbi:MAG: hypothetical protein B7Y75_05930, partial [Azorhizobium sp. 35-67-5]
MGFAAAPGADAGRWMVGRTPTEGAQVLPRVFNLCAAAHRAACLGALGLAAAPDEAAMRLETVRDQGVALFHTWPTLLGLEPDRGALTLLAAPDAVALAARLDADDLPAFSLADLDLWLEAGTTGAAQVLRQIRDRIDPAWGRAALPPLQLADLDAALAAPGAPALRSETIAGEADPRPAPSGRVPSGRPPG